MFYTLYTLIISSVILLSIRALLGNGMPIKITIINATIAALLICLTTYCISNKNNIAIDAICLFYIFSHCMPIIYVIILKKRNAQKKSISSI